MKSWVKKTAFWLTVIGGINWGLVGLFNLNIVQKLQEMLNLSWFSQIAYILIGISAVMFALKK